MCAPGTGGGGVDGIRTCEEVVIPLARSLSSLKKCPRGASPELTPTSGMEYSEVLVENINCWICRILFMSSSN